MLDDVLGAFLDSLSEREFDLPFMALLRSEGFYDIHFLHGAFEFGKDFIAKRERDGEVSQWAFQTKGGDIGLAAWREVRAQIDEMRTNVIAHPNFDPTLPRHAVLVTTGRLTGGAPAAAQQYADHLQSLGEIGFTTWDREWLLERLTDTPEAGLSGNVVGPLLGLVGAIDSHSGSAAVIDTFARTWVEPGESVTRASAAAAVISNRCRLADRLDLAAFTQLALLRAVLARDHVDPQPIHTVLADGAAGAFSHYADALAESVRPVVADPDAFAGDGREVAIWVTYPARVIRCAEVFAVHALRLLDRDDDAAAAMADLVVELVRHQPGAAHPLSDNWAASLVPIGLVLAQTDRVVFDDWAQEVLRWTCDFYDGDAPGLAGLGADPETELDYLAAKDLDHLELPNRTTSLIFSAVLDLASVAEDPGLFDLAVNEMLAVDAYPEVIEVPDNADQFIRDGSSVSRQVNMSYLEAWTGDDGWRTAPHHRRCPEYALATAGCRWEHLALIPVLRDRWFVTTLRGFLPAAEPDGSA